jgi:hypothetical protein
MDANQENLTRNISKKTSPESDPTKIDRNAPAEAKIPLVQKVCAMAASEVITPRKKQRGDDQGCESTSKKCDRPR